MTSPTPLTKVITIGPDEQGPGVSYTITSGVGSDADLLDSGGWGGTGPRRKFDPDAWAALARRRIRLPRAVRAAGLGWGDAEAAPYGWSQGSGHAPQGVTITWTW